MGTRDRVLRHYIRTAVALLLDNAMHCHLHTGPTSSGHIFVNTAQIVIKFEL